ncbi:MAG TPA: CofH family radical SAM protein [Candidatus Poseidoniales archaeon]|nr:CofH family radical SAM protein [Candidatus Poseidoniales archaeon]
MDIRFESTAGNSDWRTRLGEMSIPDCVATDPLLSSCVQTLISGGSISAEIGISLMYHDSLSALCSLASMIKKSRYDNRVFFNENLHVNTTNICVLACRFCAFRKGSRHPDAYALSPRDFVERIDPHSNKIDEVHSVGGLHPDWTVDHYVDLYSTIKNTYPHIHLKSLTAIEIIHIAERSGITVKQTLQSLSKSGLGSIPGGGAEILVDSVRNMICRGKETSSEYLEVHAIAHDLGIPTNCTMLFGTIETLDDRITHLVKLREQQDESGGFQCFVPYPFLPDRSRLPEAQLASSSEVVRMIAISRIMLDNIPHIKAYRMNFGDHLASICLTAGADDIDGTVGHEEIMHEAGSMANVDTESETLARMIALTGSIAVKRNSTYTEFSVFETSISTQEILPVYGQR